MQIIDEIQNKNRISDRKQKITKGGIEALASKLALKNANLYHHVCIFVTMVTNNSAKPKKVHLDSKFLSMEACEI